MRALRLLPIGIAAIAVLLAAGGTRGPGRDQAWAQGERPAAGDIVLAFAPGGVLTRDGTLWTFRPDKAAWVTVDEAFSQEGRETHVLPLPVSAAEIATMQSFGFLVTRSGACWLYDLEKDRWRETGPPPRRR